MRHLFLVQLVFISVLMRAQYASLQLSEANVKKLGEVSKNAILYVVINNEKDPSDAALINAVKNYWRIGNYKILGKAEFLSKKQKHELSPTSLYLYEWFTGRYVQELTKDVDAVTLSKYSNTGYFFLSAGEPKPITTKSKKSTETVGDVYLNLTFNLRSTLVNTKYHVLDGYFDLMVKYFNNEIKFCQTLNSVKDVKKEDKDGIVYFGDGFKEVQDRDILLIKEQVNRAERKASKQEKKAAAAITAVSQFNPPQKNVYTVFPEDIKMAVNKSDNKVLVFSNNMLISAKDGAVVAAPARYDFMPAKKDYGFWTGVVAILILSFGLATVSK